MVGEGLRVFNFFLDLCRSLNKAGENEHVGMI